MRRRKFAANFFLHAWIKLHTIAFNYLKNIHRAVAGSVRKSVFIDTEIESLAAAQGLRSFPIGQPSVIITGDDPYESRVKS